MPSSRRPAHNLWSHHSRRKTTRILARRTSPFVVRNPHYPPLPAWSAAPLPRTIYLTYKDAQLIPDSVVKNIADLNPDWRIQLFGDLECIAYLETHWPVEHVKHFKSIPDGPIRADFWRACIMYTHGGCYLDADTVLRVPLDSLLSPAADVHTAGSVVPERLHDRKRHQWNPAIIIARPRTRIMARTVGRLLACSHMPYDYWRGSITYAMMEAASAEAGSALPSNREGVYTTQAGESLRLLREVQDGDAVSRSVMSGKILVMQNHNEDVYDNEKHEFKLARPN